jgi:hypothetical protein
MLEMRFAGGLARFFGRALARPHPANSDASPSSGAGLAMLPKMPVPGVSWTRHVRPWRPVPPTGRRSHLRVVK